MALLSEDTYILKLLAEIFVQPDKPAKPKTPAEKIHDDLVEAFREKSPFEGGTHDHH